MTVTVKLFAFAKDLVQQEEISLEIAPASTVSQLRAEIEKHFPQLATIVQQSRFAVSQSYVNDDATVFEDCEIALIPPVSGG